MATYPPDPNPQPAVDDLAVSEVVRGTRSYDSLDARNQTAVRSIWRQQIDDRLNSLDLRNEFKAAGVAYSELDTNDAVVVRSPAPGQGT